MTTRTFGKWNILLDYHATLPAGTHADADTIDDIVAEHFPTMADLLDDYEIHENGLAEVRFAWTGDVHADEDHIEEAGHQALQDDGLTKNDAELFTIDDHETVWQGYDPADYYDC